LPFVVGLFRVFVVEHYGVIEVINYFLCVFFQIISIKGFSVFCEEKLRRNALPA